LRLSALKGVCDEDEGMQLLAEVAEETGAAPRSAMLFLVQPSMDVEQEVIRAYESLRLPVYLYLAAVVGDASEAEDICQEVFLRLFIHCSNRGMVAPESLRSWVFRVGHNLAIDRIRTRKFTRELDGEDPLQVLFQLPDTGRTPEEVLLERERLEAVQRRLAQLSSQEQHCLYLRAEGFRYREIAEILGITRSSVAEFLRRAIRKLTRGSHA
jgi:RNA polymerase sigma-70 factor (ECF subfamily)